MLSDCCSSASVPCRYVQRFLERGALPGIAPSAAGLQSERRLGKHRIDFLLGNGDRLEVKSPVFRIPFHASTNPQVQQAGLQAAVQPYTRGTGDKAQELCWQVR